MRLLVFGTGAVGAYLGGRLAAAGNPVTFLARPGWADALRMNGLRLEEEGRSVTVPAPEVITELGPALDLGPDGVVLLTVKAYDAAEAGRAIARDLNGRPPVVCLCNGIGAEADLAGTLGPERVVPATLTTAVQTLSPGTVRIERERGLGLAAGETASRLTPALARAGIRTQTYADPTAMKWSKVPTNIVANASSAILGWTAAQAMAHPGIVRLEIEALRETFRAVRRLGLRPVNLPGVPVGWLSPAVFFPSRWIAPWLSRRVARGRGDKLPSFHADIGRGRSEVRWLNGAVVDAAEQAGEPAPANRLLLRILLELVEGRVDPVSWRGRPDRLLDAARRDGVRGLRV